MDVNLSPDSPAMLWARKQAAELISGMDGLFAEHISDAERPAIS